MFQVKMVDSPEGLYMDVEDVIEFLEHGADKLDNMMKSGQLVGDFFAGEVFGYRKAAEHIRQAVNRMEG